ncbi:MAG: hypothetical protein EBY21_07200 [Alphaproteobacteria bacterium]|nr:hypothetical protein [Alphaproteobacteria bacterium]
MLTKYLPLALLCAILCLAPGAAEAQQVNLEVSTYQVCTYSNYGDCLKYADMITIKSLSEAISITAIKANDGECAMQPKPMPIALAAGKTIELEGCDGVKKVVIETDKGPFSKQF